MQSKDCFFSEIESRSSTPNYDHENCIVFFTPGATKISIQIKEGMTFSVPLCNAVSNVLPLPEGLLIETRKLSPISKESLKGELLYQNEKKNLKQSQYQFTYFSLNFHPLNQLYCVKILSDDSKREEEFGRESISKGLGFTPKVNVFSSGIISSEFASDSHFINSNVSGLCFLMK
jgi:hypothetical protein